MPIVLCVQIVLWIVNADLPRSHIRWVDRGRMEMQAGGMSKSSTMEDAPLVDVVLKAQLRRFRLPLVWPTDSTLHFVLDAIEGVDLDEPLVLAPLNPAV